MKKLLFLAFVTLALIVPAFAAVDLSSMARAVNDEANSIVKMHDSNSPNGTADDSGLFANKLSCKSDSDCVPASCCHATAALNKTFAPNCTGVACTLDCQSRTIDCGGKVKCANGKCKAVFAENETDNDSDKNVTAKPNLTKTERQLSLVAKFQNATNQNQVRLAVHTLLAMENRSGGIGKNISAIARELDNSKNITDDAEKKIQERSRIRKALFGGDFDAAAIIEREVAKNNAKIALLNGLISKCTDCTAEETAFLQDKITKLEQENTRLQTLAASEKKLKGLFGFLKRK
ncbi:MAG: hypothetical protein V1839_03150 [archaeon]